MRPVTVVAQAPPDAVSLVGVLNGTPLGEVDVGAAFEGRPGQTMLVGGERPSLLVGLGDMADRDVLRDALGTAVRGLGIDLPLATDLHLLDLEGASAAVVTGVLGGSYRFGRYRSSPPVEPAPLYLVGEGEGVERAVSVMSAVSRARDWVNLAPADKAPTALAAEMAKVLAESGYRVEVWDADRIAAERLGGLLAVAAGSARPPAMLVGRRRREGAPFLAFVGKGVVFDSGGLSIKDAAAMETMKADMAGAAAVVASAALIGARGLGVDVGVYVPLTDNMPGGGASKPGDVLTARDGQTIEIVNTDAEGRLILADALALAAEHAPDLLVDVATLTGASRVALGDHLAAVFGSSPEVVQALEAASASSGERIWPMPLPADYRKLIESPVADMKNSGGRYGGAITAALLLSSFVGDVPWAHLDIAGPAYFREDGPLGPKGASGFGVALLFELAEAMAAKGA